MEVYVQKKLSLVITIHIGADGNAMDTGAAN